jgi:hypothetical protein
MLAESAYSRQPSRITQTASMETSELKNEEFGFVAKWLLYIIEAIMS